MTSPETSRNDFRLKVRGHRTQRSVAALDTSNPNYKKSTRAKSPKKTLTGCSTSSMFSLKTSPPKQRIVSPVAPSVRT